MLSKLPCFKKTPPPKDISITFLTLCYECFIRESFDQLWDQAVKERKTDQIFEAEFVDGDKPHNKAAKYGNDVALRWIFSKWKEQGQKLDLDRVDKNGYTPLMAACQQGFSGHVTTGEQRKKCVDLLFSYTMIDDNYQINVNYKQEALGMTPLHWAAYNNDARVVQLLLEKGAKSKLNKKSLAPVDVAAICGHWTVVDKFFKFYT